MTLYEDSNGHSSLMVGDTDPEPLCASISGICNTS